MGWFLRLNREEENKIVTKNSLKNLATLYLEEQQIL